MTTTTAETTTLRAALLTAIAAAKAARAAYDATECTGACGEAEVCTCQEVVTLSEADDDAQDAVDAARAALAASDEPREYTLSIADGGGSEVRVCRPSEIEGEIEEWIREGSWGSDDDGVLRETIWVDGYYRDEDCDGERESITVQIDPEEPPCCPRKPGLAGRHGWCAEDHADGHDWQDGPARGHGAGVICRDTCRTCRLVRVTDTWAQRRDTGEQGLTSVRYEQAGQDDENRRLADRAEYDV